MAPPDTRPDPVPARTRAIDGRRALRDEPESPRHGGGGSQRRPGESFLAHFLRAPALVGGVVPSSRVLARTLSRHAVGFDAIVELGAGAGSVTRWLAADHPRARLTVVERDAAMARRLTRQWPRARICAACVHERPDAMLVQPPRTVAVSSLPFRSLPDELARETAAVIERFLLADPARRLVQYSYGLREPFEFSDARLRWRRAERVWRNVPPAIVWVGARIAPSAPG